MCFLLTRSKKLAKCQRSLIVAGLWHISLGANPKPYKKINLPWSIRKSLSRWDVFSLKISRYKNKLKKQNVCWFQKIKSQLDLDTRCHLWSHIIFGVDDNYQHQYCVKLCSFRPHMKIWNAVSIWCQKWEACLDSPIPVPQQRILP